MKTTLEITGIHCPSCVMLITMNVEELAGIHSFSLDKETGKAEIEYDESQTSLDEIKQAIRDSGDYSVS